MADTRCQSCLAEIQVIHKLGLTKSDLITVIMKIATLDALLALQKIMKCIPNFQL